MNSTGWDEINLIFLARGTDSSRDFVNTLMNFRAVNMFGVI